MGIFGDKWDNIIIERNTCTYQFSEKEEKEANISAGKISRNEKLKESWEFDTKQNVLKLKLPDDMFLSFEDIKKTFKEMVS